MPRFVLLEHVWNGVHWDFMLEAGEVLRTWAIDAPVIAGRDLPARALGGPSEDLSGVRGRDLRATGECPQSGRGDLSGASSGRLTTYACELAGLSTGRRGRPAASQR